MSLIGLDIEDNLDKFLEKVPEDAYPSEVLKNIKLMSISKKKGELAQPYGSYSYRFQKFAGDIDLLEQFKACCTPEEVKKNFSKKFIKTIYDISNTPNHIITDIKLGVVEDWNPKKMGTLKNGKCKVNIPYLKQVIKAINMHYPKDLKYFQELARKAIKKKTINQKEYDELYELLYNKYIIRWHARNVLLNRRPWRTFKGEREFTIEDVITQPHPIKIDVITFINNQLIEITNFIGIAVENENGEITPLNVILNDYIDPAKGLRAEIEKFYYSNKFYSPFKMVKRMYALTRPEREDEILEKIIPLLSSNISEIYQIRSIIEAMITYFEYMVYDNSPMTEPIDKNLINLNLEFLKNRLSRILEIDDGALNYIMNLMEKIQKMKTIPEGLKLTNRDSGRVKLLKEVSGILKEFVNYFTIEYLNEVDLNPPPSIVLPRQAKYDRSIIRTPGENPNLIYNENNMTNGEGGSLKSKLFRKSANAYRKRFCKGKARPLEENEYHLGCHNYTGPGTRIDKFPDYPPYNNIDACSRQHDIAYSQNQGNPEAIRKADEEAIKCYDKYSNESGYYAAKHGINSKMKLENAMPFLVKSIAGPSYFGKKGSGGVVVGGNCGCGHKQMCEACSGDHICGLGCASCGRAWSCDKCGTLRTRNADIPASGGQFNYGLNRDEVIDWWRNYQKTVYKPKLTDEEKYLQEVYGFTQKELLKQVEKYVSPEDLTKAFDIFLEGRRPSQHLLQKAAKKKIKTEQLGTLILAQAQKQFSNLPRNIANALMSNLRKELKKSSPFGFKGFKGDDDDDDDDKFFSAEESIDPETLKFLESEEEYIPGPKKQLLEEQIEYDPYLQQYGDLPGLEEEEIEIDPSQFISEDDYQDYLKRLRGKIDEGQQSFTDFIKEDVEKRIQDLPSQEIQDESLPDIEAQYYGQTEQGIYPSAFDYVAETVNKYIADNPPKNINMIIDLVFDVAEEVEQETGIKIKDGDLINLAKALTKPDWQDPGIGLPEKEAKPIFNKELLEQIKENFLGNITDRPDAPVDPSWPAPNISEEMQNYNDFIDKLNIQEATFPRDIAARSLLTREDLDDIDWKVYQYQKQYFNSKGVSPSFEDLQQMRSDLENQRASEIGEFNLVMEQEQSQIPEAPPLPSSPFAPSGTQFTITGIPFKSIDVPIKEMPAVPTQAALDTHYNLALKKAKAVGVLNVSLQTGTPLNAVTREIVKEGVLKDSTMKYYRNTFKKLWGDDIGKRKGQGFDDMFDFNVGGYFDIADIFGYGYDENKLMKRIRKLEGVAKKFPYRMIYY